MDNVLLKAKRSPDFDYDYDYRPFAVVLDYYDLQGNYIEQGHEWHYFRTEKQAYKFCNEFNN